MILSRLKWNKLIQLLTGSMAFIASAIGVYRPGMYEPVIVQERVIPGVFTQDLLVILASIVMIALASTMKAGDIRKAVVNIGVLGFFSYAYGIYAMEQVYTMLYPLYLAILALSFYGLIFGLASVDAQVVERLELPGWVRVGAAGYGIAIAVMFNIIWISQLIPYLQTANRIENTFSVFIIDLVFVMPGFVIAAVLALRKHPLGIIGLPALFILGAGILSPLALAELLKPARYGMPIDVGSLWMFGALSLVFLLFSVVYLASLKNPEGELN